MMRLRCLSVRSVFLSIYYLGTWNFEVAKLVFFSNLIQVLQFGFLSNTFCRESYCSK